MDKTLFSYTRHFLSGTLLSRMSGFFRDVSMAFAFGDIPEVASLILAYRLCMLLRRILGEGSMQSAFVPGYQTIKEKDPVQALNFFRQVTFQWLLGVSVLCVLLGVSFFYMKPLFSPSWQAVVELSIRLLPCLVCIIGYTLFQAFLQCHGRYFTASFAPAFSNIMWGLGCLYAKKFSPYEGMQIVSSFICIGLFLQWIVLFPETKRLVKDKLFDFRKERINTNIYGFNFFKSVALAAIGISATQINSALDGIFAKFADPKGPIHLWFSIRIQQLPLALLSIGLISAASPKLCQLIALNQKEDAKNLCTSVATKLSVLMMFLTFGIISVGDQIIRLLFEHGMFTQDASKQTLFCLFSYMIGLAPTSLATVYASFFYALKEYKKPSIASVYCLVGNLVLNALMVFSLKWGSWSVAFATSLCSFLNAYLLKRSLAQENLVEKQTFQQWLMPYLTAFVSASILFILKQALPAMHAALTLLILSVSYLGIYLVICRLFKYQAPFDLFLSFLPQKPQETL